MTPLLKNVEDLKKHCDIVKGMLLLEWNCSSCKVVYTGFATYNPNISA